MITIKPASYSLIHQINQELDGSILDDKTLFLAICSGDKEIGLFQLQIISNICANLHMHILKEFQNKGYAFHCLEPLLQYVKQLNIKRLLATIPMDNKNMLKVIQTTDFKCCGSIPNAIVYKDKLQDLVLFSLEVI